MKLQGVPGSRLQLHSEHCGPGCALDGGDGNRGVSAAADYQRHAAAPPRSIHRLRDDRSRIHSEESRPERGARSQHRDDALMDGKRT